MLATSEGQFVLRHMPVAMLCRVASCACARPFLPVARVFSSSLNFHKLLEAPAGAHSTLLPRQTVDAFHRSTTTTTTTRRRPSGRRARTTLTVPSATGERATRRRLCTAHSGRKRPRAYPERSLTTGGATAKPRGWTGARESGQFLR